MATGHGACYFKAWEPMGKRLLWPKKHWSFEHTRIFLVGGPSPAASLSLSRGLMAIIGGSASLWQALCGCRNVEQGCGKLGREGVFSRIVCSLPMMWKSSFLRVEFKVEVFCASDSVLGFNFHENIFPGNSSGVRGWCWERDSTPTLGTAFKGEMLQSLLFRVLISPNSKTSVVV